MQLDVIQPEQAVTAAPKPCCAQAAAGASICFAPPVTQLKSCGQLCEGNGCRKMVSKHFRRLVCPACMPLKAFMKCAAGCNAYIHIGCIDGTGMAVVASQSWMCSCCVASVTSVQAEQPSATCADGCTHDGKERFDDEDAAYLQLRSRGFKISTRNNDNIQWLCTHCKTTFPCKALKDGSSKWGVISANVHHGIACSKVIQPACHFLTRLQGAKQRKNQRNSFQCQQFAQIAS